MNQILSVEDTKKKNKKTRIPRNNGPVAIESILKFFAIAILVFGIFMIGSGSYSMYITSQENTANTKPTIQVEESETEITLRVSHNKALSKVTYKWNNDEEIEIQANGRREVSQTIEIPTGENILTIYAQDKNGQETTYQKSYTLEGDISIDVDLNGNNNIKITASGKNELSYMTYRWDEEEETRVDINNIEIEQDIEIPMGQHTLTVIVVDINNTTEIKTQEVRGVTKPNLEITTDGSDNFIIRVSDEEEGLKRLEFTVNDTDKYKLELEGRTELEYQWPIEDGENILDVTVYNQSDITETMRVRVNK